jgi:fructoselysine transporter
MSTAVPVRQLTFLQTFAILVGTVIGSGVFLSLPIVARIAGSPGMSILIWILGGLLWIPQILLLAEMGSAYPTQGACYVYLQKAGSPFLAFLYTWTAFLTSDTPTITIVSLSAMAALTIFSPLFGDPLWARLCAAGMIALFTWVHVRSVRTGGNLQIVITAAKMIPLLLIVGVGLGSLSSGNITFAVPGEHLARTSLPALLAAGVSSTLWSYAGFTNILYVAGEVQNPERTLPRALIGSLIFVTAGYALVSSCTAALVPHHELIAASGQFVNPFLYVPALAGIAGGLFAVGAFVSMLGVLNAAILTQPRLEYAIARDGLFFPVFGVLHPRYLTPAPSIVIQSALAILLFLLGDLENMLGYFTLSYALQNTLLYGAIFFLRRKPLYAPAYRAPLWRVMGVLAVAIQLFLAGGTLLAYPSSGILASGGLILTGLPIYFYYRRTFVHADV